MVEIRVFVDRGGGEADTDLDGVALSGFAEGYVLARADEKDSRPVALGFESDARSARQFSFVAYNVVRARGGYEGAETDASGAVPFGVYVLAGTAAYATLLRAQTGWSAAERRNNRLSVASVGFAATTYLGASTGPFLALYDDGTKPASPAVSPPPPPPSPPPRNETAGAKNETGKTGPSPPPRWLNATREIMAQFPLRYPEPDWRGDVESTGAIPVVIDATMLSSARERRDVFRRVAPYNATWDEAQIEHFVVHSGGGNVFDSLAAVRGVVFATNDTQDCRAVVSSFTRLADVFAAQANGITPEKRSRFFSVLTAAKHDLISRWLGFAFVATASMRLAASDPAVASDGIATREALRLATAAENEFSAAALAIKRLGLAPAPYADAIASRGKEATPPEVYARFVDSVRGDILASDDAFWTDVVGRAMTTTIRPAAVRLFGVVLGAAITAVQTAADIPTLDRIDMSRVREISRQVQQAADDAKKALADEAKRIEDAAKEDRARAGRMATPPATPAVVPAPGKKAAAAAPPNNEIWEFFSGVYAKLVESGLSGAALKILAGAIVRLTLAEITIPDEVIAGFFASLPAIANVVTIAVRGKGYGGHAVVQSSASITGFFFLYRWQDVWTMTRMLSENAGLGPIGVVVTLVGVTAATSGRRVYRYFNTYGATAMAGVQKPTLRSGDDLDLESIAAQFVLDGKKAKQIWATTNVSLERIEAMISAARAGGAGRARVVALAARGGGGARPTVPASTSTSSIWGFLPVLRAGNPSPAATPKTPRKKGKPLASPLPLPPPPSPTPTLPLPPPQSPTPPRTVPNPEAQAELDRLARAEELDARL